MGLFRRREPLHERLAREGGLGATPPAEPARPWGAEGAPVSGPSVAGSAGDASSPRGAEGAPVSGPGVAGSAGDASSHRWMETGVHGVPRARQWDAVVAVEAEGVEGDRARFVALADDTLVIEEGGDVEPLAAALEQVVQPPYRAEATRRTETQWAVGLRRIQVVELPQDPEGEEVTLTVHDGERTLAVDGASVFGSIPALEELGAGRASYVVQARRLDGSTWEVEVLPL